jgi:hypothetical protein
VKAGVSSTANSNCAVIPATYIDGAFAAGRREDDVSHGFPQICEKHHPVVPGWLMLANQWVMAGWDISDRLAPGAVTRRQGE